MQIQNSYLKTPIGFLKISGDNNYIYSIEFSKPKKEKTEKIYKNIKECKKQLQEYFVGRRKTFNIKIKLSGTLFQKKVWNALLKIPYGETVSYSYIAEEIGLPNASRAVGNANNKNKLVIVVPCHRVIAKNGSLAGFGASINKKKWLIKLESSVK